MISVSKLEDVIERLNKIEYHIGTIVYNIDIMINENEQNEDLKKVLLDLKHQLKSMTESL